MRNVKLRMLVINTVCLLCMAFPPFFRAGIIEHTFTFDNKHIKCDTIVSPDSNKYIRVSVNGASFCGECGNPSIPMKLVNFEVPESSIDFSILTSVEEAGDSFNLEFPLYPIQADQKINEFNILKFDNPDETVYRLNSHWSESFIYNEFYQGNGKHIVTVAIPMATYCGYTKTLQLCKKVSTSLKYKELYTASPNSQDDYSVKSRLDETIVSLYDDFISLDGKSQNKESLKIANNDVTELASNPYIILIPEYLKDSINSFVSWKRQRGCNVLLKSYEEIWNSPNFKIGNNPKIFDQESSIREWLIDKKKELGTYNLLLVGNDQSGAPIRKFFESDKNYPHPESGSFNSPAYIPTDGYFSDLTSSYPLQLQPNGHYSCSINKVTGYSPSIPVGRLLLDKGEEIDNYTKKNIIYQANPGLGDASYLNTVLVTRQLQHIDYSSLFSAIPQIKDSIIYKDNKGGNFEANRPTGEEVITAMSKCGLMSIQGHGSPLSIACSGKNGNIAEWRYIQSEEKLSIGGLTDESNNGIDMMTNINKPSILYSLSCTVMPYEVLEYANGNKQQSKYNMGSAYSILGEYGGVAFIGNTRTGWDGSNIRMEYKCGQLFSQYAPLGIAVINSANACTSNYAKYVRNLIGDPEIKPWLYEPSRNSISIDVLNNGVKISGNMLRGSSICFYDGVDKSKSFAIADNDCITIPYSDLGSSSEDFDSDLFSISVIKDQMIPYITLVSHNSKMSGQSKQFVVNTQDFFKLKSGSSYLTVNNGLLKLTCTEGLRGSQSLKIEKNGAVQLDSYKTVTLDSEVLSDGGMLKVEAPYIELGKGFSSEKNTQLTLTIK